MDDRLRIIQHLYGEDVDDPAFMRRLAEDEGLRHEYERVKKTKDRLDRRRSRRPDPAVVDRVVDTARRAVRDSSPAPRPADDRSARPPTRTWSRRLQTVSAALALLLAVGLGWWQRPGASDDPAPETSVEATAQRGGASAVRGQSLDPDAVPAWDDSDELVRIHRRIEGLQARSTTGAWGGLQTVGQRRP